MVCFVIKYMSTGGIFVLSFLFLERITQLGMASRWELLNRLVTTIIASSNIYPSFV